MRDAIYCAPLDRYWNELAIHLRDRHGVAPKRWIGPEKGGSHLPECKHVDSFDAFFSSDAERASEVGVENFIESVKFNEYYSYLKILDRIDLDGSMEFAERDRLFKDKSKYYLYVLKKENIKFVIFSNIPHQLYDYIIYIVAKWLNLKVVIIYNTSFQNWKLLKSSIEKYEHIRVGDNSTALQSRAAFVETAVTPLQRDEVAEPSYMLAQKLHDKGRAVKTALLPIFGESKILFRHLKKIIGRKKNVRASKKTISLKRRGYEYKNENLSQFQELRIKRIAHKRRKWLLAEYNELAVKRVIGNTRYVYVPLHYQPEATTAPQAGIYADQILMVERLRAILPDEIEIWVKEHYSQFSRVLHGYQGRHAGYWRRIAEIANVRILRLETSSISLIDGAYAVATATGTAGWEAIVRGKRCLVFGDAWYLGARQALRINASTTAAEVEKFLAEDVGDDDLDAFLDEISPCLIHLNYDGNGNSFPPVHVIADRIAAELAGSGSSCDEDYGRLAPQ